MFERLGSMTFRYRYLLVAAWVVAAVVCGVFAPSLASEGSADQASFLPPTAPSVVARDALEAAFPGSTSATSATITFSRAGGLTDADRAYLADVDAWITGDQAPANLADAVTGTESSTSRPELASMLRSKDGEMELLVVNLDVSMAGGAAQDVVATLRDHLAQRPDEGLAVHVTGAAGISSDYLSAIQQGTDSTTVVTVVLVLLILLLIYRAPLAALVPLVTIGAAFVVARGTLGFLAAAGWDVSSLLDTFLVVLVFGVGTDYAIFLISRYREEVGRGDWHDASRVTVKRIGAVISASAATVMVGLGAMAFGDFKMIQSTGPALAVAIFVTLIAGLTLAPAMLAIFGHYLFWPRHARVGVEGEPGGFFARLADLVSRRPGLVTVGLIVALAIPALYVPQMKTNFDVLAELPADADSRLGYEAISTHLGQDKLVQSTAIVDAGPTADMLTPASLARTRDLIARLQATPGVATVTSLITPDGDGVVPDGFRPSVQLGTIADQLSGDASTTSSDTAGTADLLDPKVDEGLASALDYVEALAAAYPDLAGGSEMRATTTSIQDAQAIVAQVRKQSVLSTQLRSLAASMTSPTAAAGGDTSTSIMSDYLAELAVAWPEVRDLPAFHDATVAAASLERKATIAAALDLSAAFDGLAAHFDGRPDATFSPKSLSGTDAAKAFRREATATFDRLPVAFRELAARFAGRSDDIFIPQGLGGADAAKLQDAIDAFVSKDRTAMRFYLTATADPYSGDAFGSIDASRAVLTAAAPGFGSDARASLGGPTAQFLDVEQVLGADFQRVGVITVLGILIVLMILLRAVVAPLYLVATVLLSYASAIGLSTWFFQEVLGQPGVSFYLPLMVFVLLVALGSDYNIFLMSRVREESEHRPIRDGIRIASGHTGAVITSAGLILAGTFGSMATAPLVVLFQVGVAVAVGVLIDTFVVRSILVPAITTLVGDRAWWPSGATFRGLVGWAPMPVPPSAVPAVVAATTPVGMAGTSGPGPRLTSRRLAAVAALVIVVPALLAGLLTWSFADPAASLHSLPAAVVDLDQAATATNPDGTASPLHLGPTLVAALEEGSATGTFAWTTQDAASAAAGLADGRYAAVLTIPDDFSTRVAAIRADRSGEAPKATLRLETSGGTGEGVAAVARDVTSAIAGSTGQHVTDAYVGDVLMAVGTAHDGVTTGAARADDVATGSTGLADDAAGVGAVADELVAGLEQLASGAKTAGSGTDALASAMRKLASGTGKLASGADDLAGGAKQAASGADTLATGADKVAAGMKALASSTSALPEQAAAMAKGASEVASGATGLAAGAKQLAGGLGTLADGTTGLGEQTAALGGGATDLASGAKELSGVADATAADAADLLDGAQALDGGVADYTATVAGLASSCAALGGTDPLCTQLADLAATNGQLTGSAAGVASGAAAVAGMTAGVADGAAKSATGAAKLADGTGALAESAPGLEKGIAKAAAGASDLATGSAALADGASQVSGGADLLAASAPQLTDAIARLSTGATGVATGNAAMAAGLDDLASGADALAGGAGQTAKGAGALASGTTKAADGAGQLLDAVDQATAAGRLVGANADRVAASGSSLADDAGALAKDLQDSAATMPGWSEADRRGIAALAAEPVQVEATATAGGAAIDGGLAPLFVALALWVGALVIFLLLPAGGWAVGPRGWRTALGLVGAWALVGVIQACVAVLVVRFGLGIDVADLATFVAFCALAGVTFAAVVQAFVALGGRRGWLLALLFLGVQLAAAGVPWGADALPTPLAALHPLLPLSWAIDALGGAVTGAAGTLPIAAFVLVAWLTMAVLVTLAAAEGARRQGPMEVAPV